ncbi:MAG: thiamine-phosphate kinase [Bacteroidia bacterium]|nr:thiamine-phosphate kinase [Bacteroidia bacterium]
MFENKNRTEAGELGEFGLIDHLTKDTILYNKSSLKGIGDDAAIINTGKGKVSVVSTDMLIEGVHFDLSYMPLRHLGYKAVVVNLSDICAMNARPEQILLSIAASNRFSLEAMEELYSGIHLACKHYKVDLVGGDTSTSHKGLMLSLTAIGSADENKISYRNTAGQTDLLCVTGDLGGAYVGYQLLEREKRIFLEKPDFQPDLEGNDYILQRQLKPEARIDVIDMLNTLGIKPSSMIDISDGLASEVHHLCKQSNIGMVVYEDKLPIDSQTFEKAREFNLDPMICALNGGEDYELLFTIAQTDYDKIKGNPDITVIGHCTEPAAGINVVTKAGNTFPLKAQGWQAFS